MGGVILKMKQLNILLKNTDGFRKLLEVTKALEECFYSFTFNERDVITITSSLEVLIPFPCLTKVMSRNDPTDVCSIPIVIILPGICKKKCLVNYEKLS